MICLHLCHVSGPFINRQSSEFTDGTSVPVSFYAGATPQRKGFAFSSRATWQIVVSLICAVWKHNPLSPTLWEITFPFHTPELFWGYPSLFFLLLYRTSNLPSGEKVGNQSHSVLLKLLGTRSAVFSATTEPLNSHFAQSEFCWSRQDFANWQSLVPCRSWKAGEGLKSGCSWKMQIRFKHDICWQEEP